jgi:imidazolonepropionase-like amidohydrolase
MAADRLLLAALLLAPAGAQDLTPKAPPQTRAIAIEHATLHPIDGADIAPGTILFAAGRIIALGPDGSVAVPDDAERIDGTGLHVHPGLIAPMTQIGLIEIGQVRATVDHSETGEVTPEARAAIAINPDSAVIPVTRSNGVLLAGVFPRGGLVAGRPAVIQLEGWTWEEMALRTEAGVVVTWPGTPLLPDAKEDVRKKGIEEAAARRARLDAEFAQARAALAARRADPRAPLDLRQQALAPVLAGEQPLFVVADRAEEIDASVQWAIARGMRPVVVGGREADRCLTLLRHHDVPVVVGGVHRLPRQDDSAVDEPFRLPAILHEAGVRFCLANAEEFYNARNLPYEAATAVAHGLPREAALRAITLAAAEILGVADRVGSLAPGKDATLFAGTGDPLEITTETRFAFVQGRRIDLRNKQTELYEKYRRR